MSLEEANITAFLLKLHSASPPQRTC